MSRLRVAEIRPFVDVVLDQFARRSKTRFMIAFHMSFSGNLTVLTSLAALLTSLAAFDSNSITKPACDSALFVPVPAWQALQNS